MISPARSLSILALLVLAALAGCAGESAGVNSPPVAKLSITPGSAPNLFVLDGSQSIDPDGDPLTYNWNWVLDNVTTSESKIEVEFPISLTTANAGYLVALVVRDSHHEPALATAPISFGTGTNMPPVIAIDNAVRWVTPGTTVRLDAGTKTADPENDPIAYEWIWGPRGTFSEKLMGVTDPCAESDSRLGVFSTGCLDQNQAYNQTFDQAGVFTIHCHPHPWMKARIVVAADAPVVNEDYEIADFGYPPTPTIGVGSTLRFINLDPLPHTATVEDWTPGGLSGGTGPVFEQELAEGEYIVRLITIDATGARSTMSWGLKASSDAPPNPLAASHDSPTPLAANQEYELPYNLTYLTLVTATLTWDDASGTAFAGTIEIIRDADTASPEAGCVAERDAETTTVTATCLLNADNYFVKAIASSEDNPSALPPNWTLEASGIVYSNPGFGDSGGDGHAHHH